MRTTFLDMFSAKRIKSAKSYSLTREFKSEAKALIVNYILLIIFNSSQEVFSSDSYDKTDEAIKALDQAKDATTRNLQKLLERDDKFDNLINKADQMGQVAIVMQKKAKKVKRKAIWDSYKVRIIFIIVLLGIIYIFIGSLCGFTLENC